MKFRHSLLVFVVALLSVAALAQQKVTAAGSTGGNTSPANVLVVNPTSQPVPVAAQGTTTVTGTVSIGNSPTVTLGSGSTVAIDPSTTVKVADFMTRNIVRLNTGASINPGGWFASNEAYAPASAQFYVVPSGKRLVINNMNARVHIPVGEVPDVEMEIVTGGNVVRYLVPFECRKLAFIDPFDNTATYHIELAGPLYADAGDHIVLAFRRDSTTGAASIQGNYQGYLVDCPTECAQ